MKSIKILHATRVMIPKVKDLIIKSYQVPYKESGPISKPYFSETYEEDVLNGGIRLFVALDGDKIIGTVQYEGEEKTAHLSQMTVDPNYRKEGVGSQLLKEAEKNAKKESFKIMELTAMMEKNLPEYYEKLGYKKVGEKKRPRYTLAVMEKEL